MNNKEKIGPGFYKGSNYVRRKFVYDLMREEVEWKPFLFYIAMMFTITKFDDDSFEIIIVSKKQLDLFYKKIKQYRSIEGEHNYEVEEKNDTLWRGYKKSQTDDALIISILN